MLGTVLGGLLLGRASAFAGSAGGGKGKRRRKAGNRRRCYPGAQCAPGQGKDNSGCDFSRGVAFFELNAQGSNLSQANFTDAQMAGANFQGADLGGACLVGANLLGAVIDASTNLRGAVYCRTLMPDGTFNDRDCGQGSRCCPAPLNCEGDLCPATCIGAPNAQCSLSIPYGGCCPGLVCIPSSTTPIRTTCQAPCGE
ncbi:MAG: pentapeptide repeat-containing protein, partial [Pseudonocardiaceae bacterium]